MWMEYLREAGHWGMEDRFEMTKTQSPVGMSLIKELQQALWKPVVQRAGQGFPEELVWATARIYLNWVKDGSLVRILSEQSFQEMGFL
jgi:hypothetical protein